MPADARPFPCPSPWTAGLAGQVVAVAAPAGPARRRVLASWAAAARAEGAEIACVSCALARGGIWAGLSELLRELLPGLREQHPELVERHGYEITTVLPELRRELQVRYIPLTETVPADEKVRSYPMDRAFRILHGLIDLLAAWREARGAGPWVLALDDFDGAGFLVSRFFRELVRRRGRALGITLLVGVDPETGERTLGAFHRSVPRRTVRLDLPPAVELPSPAEHAARARELEPQLGADLVEIEIHLPQLIDAWTRSDQPENALRWKTMAFAIYNHYGFYEDALVYAEAILPHIDSIAAADSRFTRWQVVGGLYNSYASAGRIDDARRIMEVEALGRIVDPSDLARAYYIMSMLHARFLPEKDLARAEWYIDEALATLARADEPPSDRHFFMVFLWNGLAFIRHRQGRAEEAIALCHRGFEHLNEHLSPAEHRLHRSVLLYNMGQVYGAIGDFAEGIRYMTAALEMDPYYSEYYNDRGTLHLKAGDLEAAVADYRQAIALSSPYHEVWTNLAQASKLLGRAPEAVDAFSRALDLEPDQPLLLLGRAQAHEMLGDAARARADYEAALDLDPGQAKAWSNLAVLQYEAGEAAAAVTSLDAAVRLAPALADLYGNRAVALEALGDGRRAAADLHRYLELAPGAPDREEVETRLQRLAAAA